MSPNAPQCHSKSDPARFNSTDTSPIIASQALIRLFSCWRSDR